MSKWFPLIVLKSIHHNAVIFHMVIGYNMFMTPIDFEVTLSTVKVTCALNNKMVSADYFKKISSQSRHISHGDWP
jgi:hypothetical protein